MVEQEDEFFAGLLLGFNHVGVEVNLFHEEFFQLVELFAYGG